MMMMVSLIARVAPRFKRLVIVYRFQRSERVRNRALIARLVNIEDMLDKILTILERREG
jgi:hypothetical protein